MWPAGLPVVAVLLWQLAQVPGATPAWLNNAGVQDFDWWQESHCSEVGMWLAGRVEDENRLPAWWQLLQSLGVPMNTPRW